MSPDLMARKVIGAAFLYYIYDVSIMLDSEYDALCTSLAERWDELSPTKKFQLESPEILKTTGYHIKVTEYNVRGALTWAKQMGHKLTFHQLEIKGKTPCGAMYATL
jgi:hypothetical protein